jgi:hypothetical protein
MESEIGSHNPAFGVLILLPLGVVFQKMSDLDRIASELSAGYFYPPGTEADGIKPVLLLHGHYQIFFVIKDKLGIRKNFSKLRFIAFDQ